MSDAKVAIITARGGSKRIPGKNIKDFCGKPIIAYSIGAALESGLFDEVMVSTDSTEIADVARRYGASVPFMRSAETANDYATTADVLREVIGEYHNRGRDFDWLCCIYPTAPFVTAEKLERAFETLLESGAEALMPVVQYSFPPQRALVIKDGFLYHQFPEFAKTRSQDLEPIYHDCGQFYFYRTDAFGRQGVPTPLCTLPFIVPEEETQDIDNLSDWHLAEVKYRAFNCRGGM